jgi:soluble lytic murein transglycosylase-like protein
MTALAALMLFLATAALPAAPAVLPTEPSIYDLLTDAELRHGLPPYLLHAIAQVESSMDPDAVGAAGEIGLMQLHPQWHDVSGGVPGQIETAAAYLASLIDRFGVRRGVAAYNQGPSDPRVGAYVRRVYRAWDIWRVEGVAL